MKIKLFVPHDKETFFVSTVCLVFRVLWSQQLSHTKQFKIDENSTKGAFTLEISKFVVFRTFITSSGTCTNCFVFSSIFHLLLNEAKGKAFHVCKRCHTSVPCVATTSLVVYCKNTRALTLLRCLPVNSTDITGCNEHHVLFLQFNMARPLFFLMEPLTHSHRRCC